jgi:hypothetical protein
MGLEVGAGGAGADENETEGGSVAGFVVDCEVDAVGEEGLDHEAHLDGELSGARASMLNRSAETWLVFRHPE